jgi:hypothetical protein
MFSFIETAAVTTYINKIIGFYPMRKQEVNLYRNIWFMGCGCFL